MLKKWRGFLANHGGSVAIPFIASFLLMVGLAALVVDLGRAYVVKREMQKACEAGALAGSRALGLDPTHVTTDASNGLATDLNWGYGKTKAAEVVQKNYVDGALLSDYSVTNVQAGYWDMRWTSSTAPANLNGSADPNGYEHGTNGGPPDTTYEIPAVKVSMAKATGGSGSAAPVQTFFASTLGVSTMTMQTSATAILPANTKTLNTGMFPFALPYTWVKQHWDDKPPTPFQVGSVQHNNAGGQWTSLGSTDNSASYIDSLILGTEQPAYISKGDQIFIQSGERGSIYNTVVSQFAAYPNKVYMIAIVDDGFSTGAWTHVRGFVPYQITSCTGSGNDVYVEGHFVPGYVDPNGRGVSGDYTGDPSPFVYLVQ